MLGVQRAVAVLTLPIWVHAQLKKRHHRLTPRRRLSEGSIRTAGTDGPPEISEAQIGDPSLDVGDVEVLSAQLQDPQNVSQLELAAATLLCPFELRDQRIFGRSDEDLRAQQIAFDAATHLLHGEWPRLSHDEVGLPGRRHIDDVELPTATERIESRV
jgi:hypothetical protein